MKDYAAMSDFDINRDVEDIVFGGLWCCRPGSSGNESDSWYYGNADATFNPLSPLPDYCNNPADAWPIITQYRISIIDLNDKEWGCRVESAHGVMRAINENPLRCAMIVFLMMKESKND